ncbi:hypothetical protein EXIGLDRAFT_838282 [Exidia glandulosa HHB12029]|uniref:Uncharacterized protein n=1 Tax=Exidia glandulosa HHB12029 TaxID=1314781 RepID=A0A165FZ84_EXIGL|nr:hypothetical protein EXIGLDRAFT_838282 [Exidia glandulosa HHB12029]
MATATCSHAATSVFKSVDIVNLILDYAFTHWTLGYAARLVRLTRQSLYCGNHRLYRTLFFGYTAKISTVTKKLDCVARYARPAQLVERLDVLRSMDLSAKNAGRNDALKALKTSLADALPRLKQLTTLVLHADIVLPADILADVRLPALRRLSMIIDTTAGSKHPFVATHYWQLTHLRLNSVPSSDIGLHGSYWQTLGELTGPESEQRDLEYLQGPAWLLAYLVTNSGRQKRLAQGCVFFAEEDPAVRDEGLKNGLTTALLETMCHGDKSIRTVILDYDVAVRMGNVIRGGYVGETVRMNHLKHLEISFAQPNHPFYLPMITRAAEHILSRFPALQTLLLRVRIRFIQDEINSEETELELAKNIHMPLFERACPSLRAIRYSCSQKWWDVGAKAWKSPPCTLFAHSSPVDPFAPPVKLGKQDEEFDTEYLEKLYRDVTSSWR